MPQDGEGKTVQKYETQRERPGGAVILDTESGCFYNIKTEGRL